MCRSRSILVHYKRLQVHCFSYVSWSKVHFCIPTWNQISCSVYATAYKNTTLYQHMHLRFIALQLHPASFIGNEGVFTVNIYPTKMGKGSIVSCFRQKTWNIGVRFILCVSLGRDNKHDEKDLRRFMAKFSFFFIHNQNPKYFAVASKSFLSLTKRRLFHWQCELSFYLCGIPRLNNAKFQAKLLAQSHVLCLDARRLIAIIVKET